MSHCSRRCHWSFSVASQWTIHCMPLGLEILRRNHWGYPGIPNGWLVTVVTLRCYQTWLEKKPWQNTSFFDAHLVRGFPRQLWSWWNQLKPDGIKFDPCFGFSTTWVCPKIGGNPIPSHGEFPHFSHIFPWSPSFSDSRTAHIVSRSSKPMSTSAKEVCISGLNVECQGLISVGKLGQVGWKYCEQL